MFTKNWKVIQKTDKGLPDETLCVSSKFKKPGNMAAKRIDVAGLAMQLVFLERKLAELFWAVLSNQFSAASLAVVYTAATRSCIFCAKA